MVALKGLPKTWEAYFIKGTTSGEPPVGSKSHQDSKWGHSKAIHYYTNWLPPCMLGVRGEGAQGGGHLNEYEKVLEKSHMTKHWLNCPHGCSNDNLTTCYCRIVTYLLRLPNLNAHHLQSVKLSSTVNPQTRQNSSSLNPCFLKSFGMKLLLILRNYPVLVQHYLLIFNWKECSLDTEIERTIPTIKYLKNDKWSLKS